MQTPIQIDFQDLTPNDRQRAAVQAHVALFENRFGHVTCGRLGLSGRLATIALAAPMKFTYSSDFPPQRKCKYHIRQTLMNAIQIFFTLNDAFKRARRQLESKAGRLQGETKHHEFQTTGIVTKLFEDHGFPESAEGLEVYFHKNSVLSEGFNKLKPGTQVTFVEEQGENGPQASTVRL